jgi:hypothetical protein
MLSAAQCSGLWTIRDGKQNSFPYHQIKDPLLRVDAADETLKIVRNHRADDGKRWSALRVHVESAELNKEAFVGWPRAGYMNRVRERLAQLSMLRDTDAAAVPAAFERFLQASADPYKLLDGITSTLIDDIRRGRVSNNLSLVLTLLLDGGGPLYFEVNRDFRRSAGDERNIPAISRALREDESTDRGGVCVITGERGILIHGNFPQPNLPQLGETYLFARNEDTPTNARYNRNSSSTISVGSETAALLQATVEKLTHSGWEARTWVAIPSEKPQRKGKPSPRDLFIAFLPGAEDIRLAALLTEDADARSEPGAEGRFASFAERLVKAFEGKLKERKDMPRELSLLVLRKLDPANRKVVYSRQLSVVALLRAAAEWSKGCENVPPSIRLRVPGEKGQPAPLLAPWDIAPFNLPRITRQQFIRGGTQRQEVVGLAANEAMRLFLTPQESAVSIAHPVLHRILRSRGILLEAVGHAQIRGFDDLKSFDRKEALITITLLGLTLHRLGRTREAYMEDAAFKLGQLLAGADALHAAYNVSERGGASLPPRLIGNAVLPMAQSNPYQALTVLGRRWAVYQGWATRKGSQWHFPNRFVGKRRRDIDSKDLTEYDMAQAIVRGLIASRRLKSLAAELAPALQNTKLNDVFRAELLLGYMAGPGRPEAAAPEDTDTPEQGDA